MPTYNETTSGGLKLRGCALVRDSYLEVTAFGPGDIVYNVKKARIGKLEKIVIKQQRIVFSQRGGSVAMYVDTYNGFWNEEELISYADAIALAIAYQEYLIAQMDAQLTC